MKSKSTSPVEPSKQINREDLPLVDPPKPVVADKTDAQKEFEKRRGQDQ